MSVDRRMRDGFHRSAPALEPEPQPALERVLARSRRIRIMRVAIAAVAIVASVIVVTLLGPGVIDVLRSDHERPAQPPSSTGIVGTYVVDVSGSSDPALVSQGLAGEWRFGLQSNGLVVVQAPVEATILPGRLSYQYQLDRDRMITNLFANDLCSGQTSGTYVRQRSGAALVFTLVDDPCAVRVALLTSGPWRPA